MIKRLCKWCGWDLGNCDCAERMTCDKAGQVGHTDCGTLPCGCPIFTHCRRSPIEHVRLQSIDYEESDDE